MLKRYKKLITRLKLNFRRNKSAGIQKVSCLRSIFKKILFPMASYAYSSIWQRLTFAPWPKPKWASNPYPPWVHTRNTPCYCLIFTSRINYTFLTNSDYQWLWQCLGNWIVHRCVSCLYIWVEIRTKAL